MPNITEQNDYKKHFAGFSDANLEMFLKSGHHDTAMKCAATAEVHKRQRSESETRDLRETENFSNSRKTLRISIWATIIAIIAIAVSVKEQIFSLIGLSS